MRKYLALALLLALCGCGPREIGQGMAETATGPVTGPSSAETMRFPMTGASNIQRRLYYTNRPDIMERVQKMHISAFQQKIDNMPSPEDPAYREIPKQRSPFRQ